MVKRYNIKIIFSKYNQKYNFIQITYQMDQKLFIIIKLSVIIKLSALLQFKLRLVRHKKNFRQTYDLFKIELAYCALAATSNSNGYRCTNAKRDRALNFRIDFLKLFKYFFGFFSLIFLLIFTQH